MATTAAMNLNSDLMTGSLSASANSTLMKARTTADGLDQMDTGYIEIATGDVYDILDATALGLDKANKVYICNESTDETYFIEIMINAMIVGKLYAGDWMFLPWSAIDADADIEVTAHTGTNKITYAVFHEGRTLLAED